MTKTGPASPAKAGVVLVSTSRKRSTLVVVGGGVGAGTVQAGGRLDRCPLPAAPPALGLAPTPPHTHTHTTPPTPPHTTTIHPLTHHPTLAPLPPPVLEFQPLCWIGGAAGVAPMPFRMPKTARPKYHGSQSFVVQSHFSTTSFPEYCTQNLSAVGFEHTRSCLQWILSPPP